MKTSTNPSIAFDDVVDREPALLLMPGWCGPRHGFRPLFQHLDRRALALDWRSHGESDPAAGDFGFAELVADAEAVIAGCGVQRVIPVGLAHAGWVAIELRKRLGPERVPGIGFIDWMVLGAPAPFFDVLQALQDPASWAAARSKLFENWTSGVESRAVHDYVEQMATHEHEMWARAAREIAAAFAACPSPLDAVDALACPTLHVYAQPADPAFLAAQEQYAATHSWFRVRRVAATSHFPMLEASAEVAAALSAFAHDLA
jgi:pimeloyl-ACP methyl ester carboxylesterase